MQQQCQPCSTYRAAFSIPPNGILSHAIFVMRVSYVHGLLQFFWLAPHRTDEKQPQMLRQVGRSCFGIPGRQLMIAPQVCPAHMYWVANISLPFESNTVRCCRPLHSRPAPSPCDKPSASPRASPLRYRIRVHSPLPTGVARFLKEEADVLVQILSIFNDHESYMRGREEFHRESESTRHRWIVLESCRASRIIRILGIHRRTTPAPPRLGLG